MNPQQLEQAWGAGQLVPLAGPGETPPSVPPELEQRFGPGVIVGSGGSMGGRRWCLQPLAHLQASAAATGAWLGALGLEPAACLHLNPLPLHHVSGLMPWLRCRHWGARHQALAPALMRDPGALATALPAAALADQGPVLLSLVPTQLLRLLDDPAGIAWLQQLDLIWVGGAPLPAALAQRARQLGLRLAPCYGATETAAMVCALPPERFLAGDPGCGQALADVQLRLAGASGSAGGPECVDHPDVSAPLEVLTSRLSPGWLHQGQLQPLPRSADGWWRCGDAAQLSPRGLEILGRLDGAIHSGGETVFPEQVEQRLGALLQAAKLPVAALLLLGEPDPRWGQRLVALVRLQAHAGADADADADADAHGDGDGDCGAEGPAVLEMLALVARQLPPAQRPARWLLCPQLERTFTGKWERRRWQQWLAGQA
jgi:O-succinylbenzoic acid--CoA ligase